MRTAVPTINAVGGGTDEGEEIVIGGAGIGAGCESDADADITLEGKVTITATAGKDNVAIGANGIEQEFSGLAEGSSITRYDSEGNDITLPTDPVPAVPSSSGGSSADASVQESVFPGLVVTDKDGQRISYTSIRGNNVLSLRVGRFTASLHASLSTLRQLRAEGIDTITFQTILCSTTLSVDELLASGRRGCRGCPDPPVHRFQPHWWAEALFVPRFRFVLHYGRKINTDRGKVTYGWRSSYSFHLF